MTGALAVLLPVTGVILLVMAVRRRRSPACVVLATLGGWCLIATAWCWP